MTNIARAPKVSVLMPAYNVEKYVAQAIESILNQTFADFEFIIINDGSTDRTAEIIREYARRDNRIKFVDNKKNQGLIAVLNAGLDMCTGEYIARMDSDDISLPERFALQVEYMDSHPECGMLGGWIDPFPHGSGGHHKTDVKLMDILDGWHINHPTVMMRSAMMREHGFKYDPDYKHCEDYELWSRMAMRGVKIHNLPTVLLKYRMHDTNVSVVHHALQSENSTRVRKNIVDSLSDNDDVRNVLLSCTGVRITRGYLFGFIPLIRVKSYGTRREYKLFNIIPIFKTKKDAKC